MSIEHNSEQCQLLPFTKCIKYTHAHTYPEHGWRKIGGNIETFKSLKRTDIRANWEWRREYTNGHIESNRIKTEIEWTLKRAFCKVYWGQLQLLLLSGSDGYNCCSVFYRRFFLCNVCKSRKEEWDMRLRSLCLKERKKGKKSLWHLFLR